MKSFMIATVGVFFMCTVILISLLNRTETYTKRIRTLEARVESIAFRDSLNHRTVRAYCDTSYFRRKDWVDTVINCYSARR